MRSYLKAAEVWPPGAMTLPGRYYSDPELFLAEQERIFLRHWLCAGRASEIPASGDYFVRDVDTESVIIVRGDDESLHAFHNVCRHRGTRLCEAASGTFDGAIRCPYHSWTYGLNGGLLAATSMGAVAAFNRADYPLLPVAVAEWEGWVFISLAEEPEPFEQVYAPVRTKFARYGLSGLQTMRRIDYDVRANWKLIFENYSECYHCPSVHPSLVKLSPANSGANDLTEGLFLGGYMTVRDGCGSMSLSGRACGVPLGDLDAEDARRVYYYSLFPNMLLSLHPDYVMVHTLWPQSPDRTRIECEWLFDPASADLPEFDADDAVGFWDRTNREDWHICERSQLGVASRAYRPGPYSPREGITAAFDKAYLAEMGTDH